MKTLTAVALLLLSLPLWAGTMYRWVDAEGRVHYTDTPPPASARDVKEQKVRTPEADASRLPYATQIAARNFPVTLYATDCGEPCTRARELLRKRGIPHTEKDPQRPAEQRELSRLLSGQLEVPVLKVGSSLNRGFLEEQWHIALDAAGYPRNAGAPPPAPKPAPEPAAAPEDAAEPPAATAPPEAPPAKRGPYPVYE
jgi:glutaredoxin